MKKSLHISQVDTIFSGGSYPIEFLLYYPTRLSSKIIRSALMKLAPDFWPVFGMYHEGVIHYDGYSESESFDETTLHQSFDPNESTDSFFMSFFSKRKK